MQLSVFLSLALAVRISHSSPIIKSPSRVAARQAPEPSTYPLGEACGHEWKYLNFNPEDATDQGRLQKLHDVICSGEMRAVSAWGREAALNNAAPYARYFPPSDEEDDTQAQTAEILLLIAGTSTADDGAVGALVETFVIDNLGRTDLLSLCPDILLTIPRRFRRRPRKRTYLCRWTHPGLYTRRPERRWR